MGDYYALSLPQQVMCPFEESPYLVDSSSPTIMLRRVEKFARYFKREMRFDLVQFSAKEVDPQFAKDPFEAYLFFEFARDLMEEDKPTPNRFIGACCFRLKNEGTQDSYWSMDWVWLHPYFRHRGHLRKAWPMFVKKYGDFEVEEPWSAGMEKFLSAIQHKKSTD